MKTKLVFMAALILLFATCSSESHREIWYTNKSDVEVFFRTTEMDSPTYRLAPSNFPTGGEATHMNLPSDVNGRTTISKIDTQYITWDYNNYEWWDIIFDKHNIKLKINNNTTGTVVVKEKSDLLSGVYDPTVANGPPNGPPEQWVSPLGKNISKEIILEPNTDAYALLHTRKPVWNITPSSLSVSFKEESEDKDYIRGSQLDISKTYILNLTP